jgi:hypothetical protein
MFIFKGELDHFKSTFIFAVSWRNECVITHKLDKGGIKNETEADKRNTLIMVNLQIVFLLINWRICHVII